MFYADTSALVKLVVAEQETDALRSWIEHDSQELVACDLVRTELLRVVHRFTPDRAVLARSVLDSITLIKVTTAIFDQAGRLQPSSLRSLDALHLAAAIDLGDEVEGLLTYDHRLASAAEANGISAIRPV